MDITYPIYKVYATADAEGRVTQVFSDRFQVPKTDDVLIESGTADRYSYPQTVYQVKDANGCYNYKLVDGKPVERSDAEKQADAEYIEQVRAAKLAEISDACQKAIYAGVDAADTKGTEHFGLTIEDQTNLSALASAVAQGAASVPYHADGQLCREFTAAEFSAVYAAAKAYITRNTTLCNHLLVWIRRCTTATEISEISYAVPLPADLQSNFDAIMGAAP